MNNFTKRRRMPPMASFLVILGITIAILIITNIVERLSVTMSAETSRDVSPIDVIDVTNRMDDEIDTTIISKSTLDALRSSQAYKDAIDILGHLGIYGTYCTREFSTVSGNKSYIFNVSRTDLHFVLSIVDESFVLENNQDAESYYVPKLKTYVTLNGEPKNTLNPDAAKIRFDNDSCHLHSSVYKAIQLAGIDGEFSTDYTRYDDYINLYDLETTELLYVVKFR